MNQRPPHYILYDLNMLFDHMLLLLHSNQLSPLSDCQHQPPHNILYLSWHNLM
jgi:hypothetical protein